MATEPTTVVTPATRDVALPGENVVVTPATRDEPLPKQDVQEPDQSISFNGQTYSFPASATDEQMLEFLSKQPAEKDAATQEPQEPLREQPVIKKDEGVKRNKEGQHISYMDTVKVLTGGRGHVLTKDEKKLYPKGTVIADDVVDAWFEADMENADKDLTSILEDKAVHVPDEVYDILVNMSFNLGKKKLVKFKKMWNAIEVEDWKTASEEMEDSKWFKQVKNRAVRLVNRMAALAPSATVPQ